VGSQTFFILFFDTLIPIHDCAKQLIKDRAHPKKVFRHQVLLLYSALTIKSIAKTDGDLQYGVGNLDGIFKLLRSPGIDSKEALS
jgi:hypothetical protein